MELFFSRTWYGKDLIFSRYKLWCWVLHKLLFFLIVFGVRELPIGFTNVVQMVEDDFSSTFVCWVDYYFIAETQGINLQKLFVYTMEETMQCKRIKHCKFKLLATGDREKETKGHLRHSAPYAFSWKRAFSKQARVLQKLLTSSVD